MFGEQRCRGPSRDAGQIHLSPVQSIRRGDSDRRGVCAESSGETPVPPCPIRGDEHARASSEINCRRTGLYCNRSGIDLQRTVHAWDGRCSRDSGRRGVGVICISSSVSWVICGLYGTFAIIHRRTGGLALTARVPNLSLGLGCCDRRSFVSRVLSAIDFCRGYLASAVLCFSSDLQRRLRRLCGGDGAEQQTTSEDNSGAHTGDSVAVPPVVRDSGQLVHRWRIDHGCVAARAFELRAKALFEIHRFGPFRRCVVMRCRAPG